MQQLPYELKHLVDLIGVSETELPLHEEKQLKRKGNRRVNADDIFLSGEWDLEKYSTWHLQHLQQPVLSGGAEVLAAAKIVVERRRLSRGNMPHSTHAKLGGTFRRRIPDSLRCLYSGSLNAVQRCMSLFSRAQEADDFLASLKFAA